MMITNCPFCNIDPVRVLWQNEHAFVIYDGFPVSQGHALIILKRHTPSFFEITNDERNALLAGMDYAKQRIGDDYQPAAFNIGINDGQAAGQTVPHLHIHMIPRYDGDADDPRGGVRWVISEKADYWSTS